VRGRADWGSAAPLGRVTAGGTLPPPFGRPSGLREDHVAGLELADGPLLARRVDLGSQHGHWADLRRDKGGHANIDILDRGVSNRDIEQPVLLLLLCAGRRLLWPPRRRGRAERRGDTLASRDEVWLTSPPPPLVAVWGHTAWMVRDGGVVHVDTAVRIQDSIVS